MTQVIHGRTRMQWAGQWALWWIAVLFAMFLAYQLSRPLWDADRLITEKRKSCESNGMVMAKQEVRFGTNYYCEAKHD